MLNHLRDEGILSRNPLAYTNTYGPTGGYRNRIHYAIGPTGGYRKGCKRNRTTTIAHT